MLLLDVSALALLAGSWLEPGGGCTVDVRKPAVPSSRIRPACSELAGRTQLPAVATLNMGIRKQSGMLGVLICIPLPKMPVKDYLQNHFLWAL